MRRLARSILAAALLCPPAIARSHPAGDAADSLEALARECRYQLRDGDAIAAARELLRVKRGDSRARPHEIEDAEWFLANLERLSKLPDSSRRKLARADSLDRRMRAGLKGNEAGAGARAEEWLAAVEEVLGPRDRELILVLTDVGRFLYYDGAYDAAERHLRRALRLAQDIFGDAHPFVAECVSNLAVPHILQGDLAGAEVMLRDALERKRRIHGPQAEELIDTTNNLAAVLERQGDDLGAEELTRATIELTKVRNIAQGTAPDNLNIGHFNRLGRVLRRQGEPAAAELAVREAIRMEVKWSPVPDRYDLGVSYLALGEILADRGDFAGALAAQDRAVGICRALKGAGHPDVANYLTSLAETRIRSGARRDARALLRGALAVHRRTLGNLHPETCRNLLLLARTLEDPATMQEAESLLVEAATAFDATRLTTWRARRAILPLTSPYPDLALARLALGRTDSAWVAAERGSGRTLADLLQAADRRAQSPGETAREDSLARSLASLESALGAASGEGEGGSNPRADAIRGQLARAEAEWASLQRELAARHPVAEGGSYPIERIRPALTPDAALVGWLDPPPHAGFTERWAYVIRARGPVRWVRLPSTTTPGRLRLREELDEAASWPVRVPLSEVIVAGARALHDEYLAPLEAHLAGVRRLYLVPSGRLLGAPLEAACDPGGRWTGDRFIVSYAPSATVHAWLKERAAGRDRSGEGEVSALLVGDPPYAREAAPGPGASAATDHPAGAATRLDPSSIVWRSAIAGNRESLDRLPRLPGSREEILRLKRILPGARVLLGRDASEQELDRLESSGELSKFRILHFATHALADDRSPERSALVLSRAGLPDPVETALGGGRAYDGVLRAVEITRKWRLDADLVTLSGCRTGLGKESPGEGYLGLAHAFLQVGARSLLVSLWEVDDRAASLLMGRFYENLAGTMNKSEALQEAKRWLRSIRDPDGSHPFEHPVYWSAFILIGDPD